MWKPGSMVNSGQNMASRLISRCCREYLMTTMKNKVVIQRNLSSSSHIRTLLPLVHHQKCQPSTLVLSRSYSIENKTSNLSPGIHMDKQTYFRLAEEARKRREKRNATSAGLYSASVIIAFLALSYAAVPLYRVLCATTGFSGTPVSDPEKFGPERLIPIDQKKRIKVSFSSSVSAAMPWKFIPQQREVHVLPGETALAFYKAKNTSDRDIIGMATYSVVPEKAAAYFSKIQCFCFEEQQLAAGEEVDMPVFFFIDPDFAKDPLMKNVDDIMLHYTFFKAQYNDDGVLSPVNTAAASEILGQNAVTPA